jgi:hypothetical protein
MRGESLLTYGRLDKALRSLNFAVRTVDGEARIYRHGTNGAAIYLPDVPFEQTVLPHHLVMVRTILQQYDIPAPPDFALKLQTAG